MSRRIPEDRFDRLVRGATEEFIARGYQKTQISDIAETVGVAKGTLYGYVESKDALFLLCLRFADSVDRIPLPEALPLPAPPSGSIGALVKARLADQFVWPALESARAIDRARDIEEELVRIIAELYDLMAANRHGIKLLDRCTDHPELGDIWQVAGREQSRLALSRYFEARKAAGQIRAIPDVHLATRFVIEACTTWAVHIHWDRAPDSYDPDAARANTIDFLVRGLIP